LTVPIHPAGRWIVAFAFALLLASRSLLFFLSHSMLSDQFLTPTISIVDPSISSFALCFIQQTVEHPLCPLTTITIMSTPLLYMPLKVPPRHDLVQPLANWLDEQNENAEPPTGFGDTNDDDGAVPTQWMVPKPTFSSVECRSELLRLAALRNCLSEHLQDSHKAALEEKSLEDCQDYHATLIEFERRGFPTVESEATENIALTWRGAFATQQLETHHSLVWDRVGCLWNVAALQSYQAATAQDLSTKEGCKSAVSLLQSSASLLATLQELVGPSSEDYSTVDCSSAMLHFWETLLKAQAQYCIYKMANLGAVKQHSTLAYLVQAAAGFYNDVLQLAQDPRLQSEVPKQSHEWATYAKAQSLVCQSRATFHCSIEHRLQQEHGLELARLSQCVLQLKECFDFWKSAGLDVNGLQGLVQLARDRLEKARHDNDVIYLDDVPTTLPDIRSQSLVKSNLPLPPAMMQPKVSLFQWINNK
jgi:hypothetical protein